MGFYCGTLLMDQEYIQQYQEFLLATDNSTQENHEKDFSLLLKLEHLLSPYVAFGIMPLFALG